MAHFIAETFTPLGNANCGNLILTRFLVIKNSSSVIALEFISIGSITDDQSDGRVTRDSKAQLLIKICKDSEE
ncbi:hypothetical protein J5N97_028080 [Dioscorea zingiberensis]|uniref:Uncharacterized protein n=1 Tax=Dioscorea zingiberensis TaxID=325984 RepID=A0A9D5H4H9_9LILI|nr:hypothetical protein J5N97_028080 [Dioscorea zingiberensis]